MFITIVLVVALVAIGLFVEVREVRRNIDLVTGSMNVKTTWLFGLFSTQTHNPSPLELRLKKSGLVYTPSWQGFGQVNYNAFGIETFRGCGSTPPIYRLSSLHTQFARLATDEELVAFVKVMQSGSDDEQDALIRATNKNDKWYH